MDRDYRPPSSLGHGSPSLAVAAFMLASWVTIVASSPLAMT